VWLDGAGDGGDKFDFKSPQNGDMHVYLYIHMCTYICKCGYIYDTCVHMSWHHMCVCTSWLKGVTNWTSEHL